VLTDHYFTSGPQVPYAIEQTNSIFIIMYRSEPGPHCNLLRPRAPLSLKQFMPANRPLRCGARTWICGSTSRRLCDAQAIITMSGVKSYFHYTPKLSRWPENHGPNGRVLYLLVHLGGSSLKGKKNQSPNLKGPPDVSWTQNSTSQIRTILCIFQSSQMAVLFGDEA
jgi:hypothetical protein